jgi:hypothetical protein
MGNADRRLKDHMKAVSSAMMARLAGNSVPHHPGIAGLAEDLEFHYRLDKGNILSSTEQAVLYLQTDVRFHSDQLEITYKIGKRVFHVWAELFHPEDYSRIRKEVCEHAGIPADTEAVIRELAGMLRARMH